MKRIDYLINKFYVIDVSNLENNDDLTLRSFNGQLIFMVGVDTDTIYIPSTIFEKIMAIDPTKKKIYLQWLLNKYESLGSIDQMYRFVYEDADMISDDLLLFENNKRKKKFKELCEANHTLRKINNFTDINQFPSVGHLASAVYPFKEINISDLEKKLIHYSNLGEASIPVNSKKFIVFIPHTLQASRLFHFTSWCTATSDGTMFNKYREESRKGDKTLSDLIIFIPKTFISGETDDLYQLHMETNQLMNRWDKNIPNFHHVVIDKCDIVKDFLSNYIKEVFILAKANNSLKKRYYGYIKEFKLNAILISLLNKDTLSISLKNINIGKLPSLKEFKQLQMIYLSNTSINQINAEIFSLKKLNVLSIPHNGIYSLPEAMGNSKSLTYINLVGNNIKTVSDNIKYLDKSNGGNLETLSISNYDEKITKKLKDLLPTTNIVVANE